MTPPLTEFRPLTQLNRSLVVTAVLAALMLAAIFWLSGRDTSDDAWVVHSLSVRDQLIRILSLVQSPKPASAVIC